MEQKNFRNYINLPLGFQVNCGQNAPDVKFALNSTAYNIFLTPCETVIALKPPAESTVFISPLRLKFNRANEGPKIIGLDKLPGKINYLLGEDSSNWYIDIPLYAKVKYMDVYPGIDVVYSINKGHLEWDYIVQPGANPGLIAFEIDNCEQLSTDEQENLHLTVQGQQLRITKPVVYQKTAFRRNKVSCNYRIAGRQVSLSLGPYDTSQPLIIDPVITFSSYLGGSETDYGYHIAADPAGNIYLTGTTASIGLTNPPGFPTKDPYQANNPGPFTNAFVTKINASGSLVYSTYLGGTGADGGHGIAVDTTGAVYITGQTTSDDFPTIKAIQATFNGFIDAFVTKLNPAGNDLVYSTYLGGRDGDVGFCIALDPNANAYITGYTESSWAYAAPGFPIKNPIQADNNNYPSQDVFITKINADGSLGYSTYLGGWKNDIGYAIAVDSGGNAYITGSTQSSPPVPPLPPLQGFPITPGCFQSTYGGGATDAFITKINADGSLGYSTYLGGADFDEGRSIAVDTNGYTYITGFTASSGVSAPPGFPTLNPIQTNNHGNVDVFVTKLNPTGSSLVYSTYLGGTEDDRGTGIAVDLDGSVYITGATMSSGTVSPPGFPIKNPIQADNNGSFDSFITKLSPTGTALQFSTYLGGKGAENDFSFYSPSIALSLTGNIYVTGSTWSTWTPSAFGPPGFPVVNPIQSENYGASDVYVLQLVRTANLLITKSASPSPAQTGDILIFQISIVNLGPDAATNVTLTDQLPPGVDFISVSSGCSQADGTVTCNLGTLGANEIQSVTIAVRPQIPGFISNTATVTSSDSSPASSSIYVRINANSAYTNITIKRDWGKYPIRCL